MDFQLSDIEARVLGALMEKEITTPEYYPLSLNALVNACNQKSNREPVMNLDDDAVAQAMRRLSDLELAGAANTTDSRVRKYEHRLQEVFNFTRPEAAILCVLLLRAAQTPGELRGRSERMYQFEQLSDVQTALQKLGNREPSLVSMLPRQPGTKESRYIHLLSGNVTASASESLPSRESDEAGHTVAAGGARRSVGSSVDAAGTPIDTARERSLGGVPTGAGNAAVGLSSERGSNDLVDDPGGNRGRVATLESDVARLRDELAELKRQFAQFRKQFE